MLPVVVSRTSVKHARLIITGHLEMRWAHQRKTRAWHPLAVHKSDSCHGTRTIWRTSCRARGDKNAPVMSLGLVCAVCADYENENDSSVTIKS